MKSCHVPYATELALDRVPQNMDMCELKNRNQHAACGESSQYELHIGRLCLTFLI